MPFVLPTIPFTAPPQTFGAVIVARPPTPTVFGGIDRLDASFVAIPPGGHIATLVSLGFSAGFAPPGTQTLTASCTAIATENGLAEAFLAWSRAFAGLRIFIEEFSPSMSFLRGVAGPMTTAFDLSATVFGIAATNIGQRRSVSASFIFQITAGRFYRIWVDSVQSADCNAITGPAAAVSNCTFDFGPVFFAFV